jgi:hypothetical protein
MDKWTAYTLFFAIFWGGIMNVSGRWRMFQPIFKYWHIVRRFWLSFILLNVGPIVYFICQQQRIKCIEGEGFWLWVAAISPALTIFAFYRLWMALVEWRTHWFYQTRAQQALGRVGLIGVEPTVESLQLDHGFGPGWNFGAAAFYVGAGVGLSYLITWSVNLV